MLSQSIGSSLEKIPTNLRTLTAMMKNISSNSCWLITKVTRTLAETRLANIFAELANVEHRPQVLEAIRKRPACLPYLAAYVGAATNDMAHPLRYLQRYLSDQLQFKIPVRPSAEPVAAN